MRKARYFIRCTIENPHKTEVHDGSGRYATLREARVALKRLTDACGVTDLHCRFSKDKNTLFRYYESDDTRFIHSILSIKLLQAI